MSATLKLDPSAIDLEALADKAVQLEAMLTVVTGNGFKAFSGDWPESTQHDYLCACQSFAGDLREMTRDMLEAV